MPLFAIVVEGSHDASFLGQLLKARDFIGLNKLSQVPAEWRPLFPKQFPHDGENLDRIMRFPELFVRDDVTVGITTAGSDSKLVSTLRSVLDAIGSDQITGVALFIDIDDHDASERFQSVCKRLTALNEAAAAEGQPGYPIAVPTAAATMVAGLPAVGVYLFPDNASQGCLEDLLLECAHANHPHVAAASVQLVDNLDASCPADQPDLKKLRSGMGMKKAAVGAIANVLKPGASVAASLAQTKWLSEGARTLALVQRTDAFLGELLSS